MQINVTKDLLPSHVSEAQFQYFSALVNMLFTTYMQLRAHWFRLKTQMFLKKNSSHM